MAKDDIVENVFFIDVKYRGILLISNINIGNIFGNIIFGFLMPHLDIISLNAFLLQLPSSNGSIIYRSERLF